MAKGKNMSTNGITLGAGPLKAQVFTPEMLTVPTKPPVIWGQALEMCRMAKRWSRPDLISKACRGATPAQVKRWEDGSEYPAPRFTDLLRKFLPAIREFDDKLPPYLREDPKAKHKPAAEPAEAPAREVLAWAGPPAAHFGLALKYVREKAGMGQADLALIMGVGSHTISRWERMTPQKGTDTFYLIQGIYEKLCEEFPMLRFAPKPKFSPFRSNQMVTEKFLEAKAMRGEAARMEHQTKEVLAEATRLHKEAITPKPVDEAPVHTAAATYGVLAGRIMSLKAKKTKMEAEYLTAFQRLDVEISMAEEEKDIAEKEMQRIANQVHGGEVTL